MEEKEYIYSLHNTLSIYLRSWEATTFLKESKSYQSSVFW